jgi:hypothetical protein
MNKIIIFIICIYCFSSISVAQKQTIKPDISAVGRFKTVNRDIAILASDPAKVIVHLNGKPGDGVAWINNITFEKGIIEFDVKGKNVLQQSFVGIAFHGLNDSTFDAIYFRPFNFQSPDVLRKNHSVQYVSLPQFDWSALREKYPGKYENSLLKALNPEGWFHAKVVVDATNIAVYVNDDKDPSLVVKPISNRTTGKIGFWVGNNSDGDFSNLTIRNN